MMPTTPGYSLVCSAREWSAGKGRHLRHWAASYHDVGAAVIEGYALRWTCYMPGCGSPLSMVPTGSAEEQEGP